MRRSMLFILISSISILSLSSYAFGTSIDQGLKSSVNLTILHLNDVYQISPVETREIAGDGTTRITMMGGLSRLKTLIDNIRKGSEDLLIIHAGDMISPSILSWKAGLKGRHMIHLLNLIGLDMATFGNHEFDFGCMELEKRVSESRFTWISSNIDFPPDSAVFKGGIKPFEIKEINGIKIGFFGLTVGRGDIECPQYNGRIHFNDPIEIAGKTVSLLKNAGAEVIIGVTHLTLPVDQCIAKRNPEIDLILGGHEHEPINANVNGSMITKTGSDARYLGKVRLVIKGDKKGPNVLADLELIPVGEKINPDPLISEVVNAYEAQVAELKKKIGSTDIELDASELALRSRETNLGDYIADLVRVEANADIAIINSGGLRDDRIIEKGPITLADVYSIHPFNNRVVSIEVTGKIILEALENGVSRWEGMEGRFPQISGLAFSFDPSLPPDSRIRDISIQGKKLRPDKIYLLATLDFIVKRGGEDGYSMLEKKAFKSHRLLTDIIIEEIKRSGAISPKTDGRIINLRPDTGGFQFQCPN
ncbi:MAG: 5'-nucleotidase C-terminal domain-containing protein [Nitrospirota bacterium]